MVNRFGRPKKRRLSKPDNDLPGYVNAAVSLNRYQVVALKPSQTPHTLSKYQTAPYVRYPPSVIYPLPHMHKCHDRDNDLDTHYTLKAHRASSLLDLPFCRYDVMWQRIMWPCTTHWPVVTPGGFRRTIIRSKFFFCVNSARLDRCGKPAQVCLNAALDGLTTSVFDELRSPAWWNQQIQITWTFLNLHKTGTRCKYWRKYNWHQKYFHAMIAIMSRLWLFCL